MLKRLSTVLLFGGLLGLVPATAQATPVTPAEVVQSVPSPAAGYDLMHKDRDNDHHYRCMYRCDDRHHKHKYKHKHRYNKHRSCWYYNHKFGWYRARCGRHGHGHGHDH